jgi:Fur family ferric uptake transcriptional regulator
MFFDIDSQYQKRNIMEKTKEAFRSFIDRKNLRHTHQRELLIEELYFNKGHMTPDEFYDIIKSKYPEIGKATVYRALKLFEEAKLISKVEFGDGKIRYELCSDKEHHDHMICEICNRSIEVIDPRIESLQVKLAEAHGFRLTGHRLYLYGICKDCQKK